MKRLKIWQEPTTIRIPLEYAREKAKEIHETADLVGSVTVVNNDGKTTMIVHGRSEPMICPAGSNCPCPFHLED